MSWFTSWFKKWVWVTIAKPTGSGKGSTSPGSGTRLYQVGSTLTVTAYPDLESDLTGWILDGKTLPPTNPINVKV